MSELDELVAAIARVRAELPALAGDAWPRLQERLDALLALAEDPAKPAALTVVRLRQWVAEHPAVNRRVQEALQTPVAELPPSTKRGPPASEATRPEAPMEPRFVNVALLRGSDATRVPADQPLAPGAEHLLRLDVGALSPESIVDDAGHHPFPAHQLPPSAVGHWLEVGVASADFRVPAVTFPLFLPRRGAAWICPCEPGGAHSCKPAQRKPQLLIPVRTPDAAVNARLRIVVWFQTAVVQSLLVVADVGRPGTRGAQRATVDYTLTERLADLDAIEPRTLSVVSNESADGSHAFVLNAGTGAIGFTIAEGHLTSAMQDVRTLLLEAHAEGEGRKRRSRLDARNGKNAADFAADLDKLARAGWRLWWGLAVKQPDLFPDAIAGPGATIHIARVPATTFVFPWAALYDLPIDAGPDARFALCPLVARWDGAAPLFDGYPDCCPKVAQHTADTLCPFGFWGFRHAIELPASTGGRPLPRAVAVIGRPAGVVVRSRALDGELAERHVAGLATALHFELQTADDRDAACASLAQDDLTLAEFYCHGRGTPERHWLEVGDGEEIHPEQIGTWMLRDWAPRDRHWKASAPLILLNGCHTAELTPQSPVSFVDSFAAANAGGVVGTEIALTQPMAGEATERLLGHFAQSVPVGEAVRRMRLDLLRKGNVLGLAYTAYCSADLRLTGATHAPVPPR